MPSMCLRPVVPQKQMMPAATPIATEPVSYTHLEPERLYTRTMLEEAFGDFTSLEIADHDSALKEGDHHVGMSALVDLVGRK